MGALPASRTSQCPPSVKGSGYLLLSICPLPSSELMLQDVLEIQNPNTEIQPENTRNTEASICFSASILFHFNMGKRLRHFDILEIQNIDKWFEKIREIQCPPSEKRDKKKHLINYTRTTIFYGSPSKAFKRRLDQNQLDLFPIIFSL